jgi:hypothetical protein
MIRNFEVAGVVAHQDIFTQQSVDTYKRTFSLLNDNSPTISHVTKGSITSRDAAAYLSRLSSLHQRHHHYHMHYDHISSVTNAIADHASRLWNLINSQLLLHFQQTYPQLQPW